MNADIKFNCRECGYLILAKIDFEGPNLMAEKMSDSTVISVDYVCCPKCDEEHEINIWNSFFDLYLEINGVDTDSIEKGYPYDEDDDLEWLSDETINFLDIYKQSITTIESLLQLQLPTVDLENELGKMLFVHVITAIETYLGDMIRSKILTKKENIQKLIETDPTFANQKFSLNEIYKESDKLSETANNYLSDLIYHNLHKIKPLCKTVLNIDFPKDLSFVFRAISMRHDLVHRNGKTKDGEIITVSKDNILTLIEKANQFLEEIDSQVSNT